MYKRIITHADLDGVISAAICSYNLGIQFFMFTQPRLVSEAKISITKDDIVCDLPYPLECGLWFDHHDGNREELVYRKIEPENIPGRFEAINSCAHVVYDYFRAQDKQMPDFFLAAVAEADVIDAFNYKDIDDWRVETPGKIIDATIKVKEESAEQKWEYLRNLVRHFSNRPIDEIAKMTSVQKRYRSYCEEEQRMIEQIRDEISFLPQDADHKIIIIDLTHHNRRPMVFKQLAYLVHPECQAVLQVGNVYQDKTKTNDLMFSMSLSLNMNKTEHHKDIGDIMRQLNLGSGHPGAAAGTIACASKDEMLRTKMRMLNEIYDLFLQQ
ncbi:hypothetical protein JXA02_05685 [candidate division KSB1 bacterium]|nr:hypothetical protein [candidate division KSB1 bacterium]RQW07813.1 MAG: hypothetical protein EH222_06500 [candidate division KSB1 bacterium]